MGIRTTFFAVPADVALSTLIGPHPSDNEALQFLGYFFQVPSKGSLLRSLEQDTIALWSECLNKHPELPQLELELGKRSGWFHFLLCPCEQGRDPDPTERLFHDAFFACHIAVRASQGVPLAYLPAPMVQQIARALQAMDHGAFGRHYNAEGSERHFRDRDTEPYEQCTWLHEWFDEIRAFFVDTAKFGHAVMRVED